VRNGSSTIVPSSAPLPYPAHSVANKGWRNWIKSCFSHVSALIYLKKRLAYRRWQREPVLGRILLAIFYAIFSMGAFFAIFVAAVAGYFLYEKVAEPSVLTILWNGVVGIFMVAWFVSISTDIQRNEAISLDRLLHLPISPSQAFTMNYLSSWINFPMLYFASTCIGLLIGGSMAVGPKLLLGIVPLIAYLTMVTALTSQLQIVIASWMANPRLRRWIVFLIPLLIGGFFAIVPLTFNRWLYITRTSEAVSPSPPTAVVAPPLETPPSTDLPEMNPPEEPSSQVSSETSEPLPDTSTLAEEPQQVKTESDGSDPGALVEPIEPSAGSSPETPEVVVPRKRKVSPFDKVVLDGIHARLRGIDRWVPPMWFAACMESVTHWVPDALWLVPAMLLISAWSIRKNYDLTVRFYQNGFDQAVSSDRATAAASRDQASIETGKRGSARIDGKVRWMERSFWGLSETTSAIVAQSWLAAWRAPEMKLQLLIPLVQPAFFLFIMSYWKSLGNEFMQSLTMIGVAAFGLYTSSSFLGNMFGPDRAGFRTWVLSPIPRVEIFQGRNLAFGIPALILAILLCLAIGIVWRVPIDKVLFASIAVASFLPLYLLITNCMSILSPFGLPQGSITPKHFSWKNILISLLLSTVIPVILGWSLLPLGIEYIVESFWPSMGRWPIALLLSPLWLAGSLLLYQWLLPSVGKLFASWELTVLKTVVSQEE